MEGLFAIIILTLVNVLEILILLHNSLLMPLSLFTIAAILLFTLIMIFFTQKKFFWPILTILVSINLLNTLYILLGIKKSYSLYLALFLNIFLLVFAILILITRQKKHTYSSILPPRKPFSRQTPDENKRQALEKYIKHIYAGVKETPSSTTTSKTYSPGKYIASKRAATFHNPRCDWAKKISWKNQIWFNSEDEATNQGYKKHNCNK